MKFSELTKEQQAEVCALGYVPLFEEISEADLAEKIKKALYPKTNGNSQAQDKYVYENAISSLSQCLAQMRNIYTLKLLAEKQRNAELIGVIGEAYQWVEESHKDFDLDPSDCLINLRETLEKSDQAERWLDGTELVGTDEGYKWEWQVML